MQYRTNPKNGEDLSLLGFGCMRFTSRLMRIDREKAERELILAIENGVNYLDTAYIYNGSEELLGNFLAKGYRDRVKLTTKLPHYLVKKPEDIARMFSEQQQRLKTKRFDYYLIHMLNDTSTWERMRALGIENFISEKKCSGEIGGIGFSFHGDEGSFISLIDAYDWDICQIQYNYLDEYRQAGTRGLKYAHEKGLPVVIMEPLRGGRLVFALPDEAKRALNDADPNRSPAAWGLRWVMNHPEVTVVLSGMNSEEMVLENCKTASDTTPLSMSGRELEAVSLARDAIELRINVPCTGCGYCMPCPAGVDIPGCFSAYNTRGTQGFYAGMKEYFMNTQLRGKPTNAGLCVECGRCEQHCPQNIQIRSELKNVRRSLENLIYRILRRAARLVAKL